MESDVLTGRTSRQAALVTVAGPLCFAGDMISVRTTLPRPREGDRIVVHDAGANTIALFSRHCSRAAPPVYAFASYDKEDYPKGIFAVCVKETESDDAVLQFWG